MSDENDWPTLLRELADQMERERVIAAEILAALKRLRTERGIPGTETLAVVDAAIAKAEGTSQ